jgi:hypothetical protein
MARAPRKKSQKTEAELAVHRARQARYRARLKEAREPEAEDVQTAVWQAIRAFNARVSRGGLSGSEERQEWAREFLEGLFGSALRRLEEAGYDRKRAKRRLRLILIPPYPGRAKALPSTNG